VLSHPDPAAPAVVFQRKMLHAVEADFIPSLYKGHLVKTERDLAYPLCHNRHG
jgi:hypothetical protein